MKKADQNLLLDLMSKKVAGTITPAEKKQYQKLLTAEKTDNGESVKADREKYAQIEASAEKRAKNIMRLAIAQAIEIYAEAGLLDTPKAKSLKFSYNKKCSVKVSAKNIDFKFVSHSQTKATAKAKADRKKAKELKRKIADEEVQRQQKVNLVKFGSIDKLSVGGIKIGVAI
jgi:hypothetical protein